MPLNVDSFRSLASQTHFGNRIGNEIMIGAKDL